MPVSHFSQIDWIIVGAYLCGTVVIGLLVNRYIKGMGDFLVAGRSLRTRLGIATMVGSELGLVTAMYAAQKGFTGGFAAFHIGLLAGIATLAVGLTGFIVVPLRRMKVMTIPEFYERRFGSRRLRIVGGLILAASGILNMGMFLKAGALFVTGLTGIDPAAVKIVMTVMIVLVLLYTALGGIVSVVLTDYFQFVILSIGLLLACAAAVIKLGWGTIVAGVKEIHGAPGFNPFDGDGFGGSYITFMLFMGVISCAVWQTAVMRACAAESIAVVKRMYIWSSIGFMIRFMIPQFLGICALVFLWQNEATRALFFDASGAVVDDSEQTMRAMPVFLGQLLPVGVIGLVAAGMVAAFMSTHDTYLLCWASVLTEDVINPLAGEKLSQRARLAITRVLLVAIAAFLLIFGLWYQIEADLWDYMAVSGAIYFTGAFAILLLGLYWERSTAAGAFAALGVGVLAVFGLEGLQKALGIAGWLTGHGVTGAKISLGAAALAIVAMVVVSLLSDHPRREARS